MNLQLADATRRLQSEVKERYEVVSTHFEISSAVFAEAWRGAVRSEIEHQPGMFAAVWDQRATSWALARACEIVDAVEIGSTKQHRPLVAEVVRVYSPASARASLGKRKKSIDGNGDERAKRLRR